MAILSEVHAFNVHERTPGQVLDALIDAVHDRGDVVVATAIVPRRAGPETAHRFEDAMFVLTYQEALS